MTIQASFAHDNAKILDLRSIAMASYRDDSDPAHLDIVALCDAALMSDQDARNQCNVLIAEMDI